MLCFCASFISHCHTHQDSFVELKEAIGMSVAGGRNNLIQLMEVEKGTHVDIAHPLPVWVLDRSGDIAVAAESLDDESDAAGVKRERSVSDDSSDLDLVRQNPLKALYFIGLALRDECKVCAKDSPVFFSCPIKGVLHFLLIKTQTCGRVV